MKDHEKPWKTMNNSVKKPVKRWLHSDSFGKKKKPHLLWGKSSGTPGASIPKRRQDWFRIDPNFGTTEDMKRLVNKTHELGDMAGKTG